MNQKLIKDLQPGDSIVSFFVVRKKELKEKKENRELYITLEFGDRSGRIRGSVWNHIESINKAIQPFDIIKMKGKVITFQNHPHISIEKIRKAIPRDNVSPEQFVPVSEHNLDEIYASLLHVIDTIKDPYLGKLLGSIFNDTTIRQNFMNASAAKLWHHNYIGGLLEHTASLVKICDFFQQHYPHVNRDLLLTAAMTHDIGKMIEFELGGYIDYSTAGRLLGHIALGSQMIIEKMNHIENFPEELKQQLLHCILSHHGSRENGSPVVPMTLEALLLYHADETDAKAGAYLRIMRKEMEPGKKWSNYVNLLDRFLYFGKEDVEQ